MLDFDAKLYPLLSSRKRMPAFRFARPQTFMADDPAPTDRSYLLLDIDNERDGFLFQESMRDPRQRDTDVRPCRGWVSRTSRRDSQTLGRETQRKTCAADC